MLSFLQDRTSPISPRVVCSNDWLQLEDWQSQLIIQSYPGRMGIQLRSGELNVAQAYPEIFQRTTTPGDVLDGWQPFWSPDYLGYYFTSGDPCDRSNGRVVAIAETLGVPGLRDPSIPTVINICPEFLTASTANALSARSGYTFFDTLDAANARLWNTPKLCDSVKDHLALSSILLHEMFHVLNTFPDWADLTCKLFNPSLVRPLTLH